MVQVAREASANLGLRLVDAEIRPMESTLAVIGEIAPLPNRAGAVTSRIAGRVTWIGVAEGDRVRKGDALVNTRTIPGYSGTGMGLVVLSENSPKAHIHFDSVEMQALS